MNIDAIAIQPTEEESKLARKYRYDNAIIMCLDMLSKECNMCFDVAPNHAWAAQFFNDKCTQYTVIRDDMGDEGFKQLSNVYMAFINGRA